MIGFRENDRKLIASVTRYDVITPADGFKYPADSGKDLIPFLVTVKIIELFEVVHIYHQE